MAAAALYLLLRPGAGPTPPPATTSPERPAATAPGASPRPSGGTPAEAAAPRDKPKPRSSWSRKLASARARQELLEIIERARNLRLEGSGGAATGTSASGEEATGRLDGKYIQSAIKDAIPLVKECYQLALHDTPDLSGKVIVEFSIVAEAGAGGIVESVDILSESGIGKDQTLTECLSQTVLSLQFPEPEDGGKVEVRYPMIFKLAKDEAKE